MATQLPPPLLSSTTTNNPNPPPTQPLKKGITASFSSNLKRKLEIVTDTDDLLQITPLGAGNEVGRSCIILKYRGKTVMLDAGIHPAHEGIAGLPFYDAINPKEIDLVLITHFHLDHAASLPYFMEKTSYQGPVYMTHPTKAIYKWFLTDYVRVSTASVDDMLFDEQDLLRSYEKISVVDYRQEMDVDGIRFTPYNAGHVLGAAMFLIEIAGTKVLYTGDYSREEDRHLMAAERPAHVVPEVLICEATYGNQVHEPRLEREARFTSRVQTIVQRGGRCLIPVFALGRAQELLLILDEYWHNHPELDQVPIYFASSLAKKCMAVYQTYINMMNAHIRHQFSQSNPFIFKHISNLKHVNNFDDTGPCVMVASPGMLQNGLSRELFERWCGNPLNGLVLCGYSVEGTLARSLLASPESVTSLRGTRLPLRMSVDYISFSAHVDFNQNSEFIDQVGAPNLVLVHGEPVPMGRLRVALCQKYQNPNEPVDPEQPRRRRMAIFTPRNTETVKLPFRADKLAKTVGKLALVPPPQGSTLSGVLIGRDFEFRLMDATDLHDLAGLPIAEFQQRQLVPFPARFSLITTCLTCMFGSKGLDTTNPNRLIVLQAITIIDATDQPQPHVILEWEGSDSNDMVADGVLASITSVITSPSSIKLTKSQHHHNGPSSDQIIELLKDHFDTVTLINEVIHCELDDFAFDIHPSTLTIIPDKNIPTSVTPSSHTTPPPVAEVSDSEHSPRHGQQSDIYVKPTTETTPITTDAPLLPHESPAYQTILARLQSILEPLRSSFHIN